MTVRATCLPSSRARRTFWCDKRHISKQCYNRGMKTISQLRERWWYRLLKIVYIAVFVLNFFLTAYLFWISTYPAEAFFLILASFAVQNALFFFFRGVFYYIAVGKFSPPLN